MQQAADAGYDWREMEIIRQPRGDVSPQSPETYRERDRDREDELER
jgi:hypothetical protein